MTYHPLANPVEKYGQFYGLPSLESPQGGPKNHLKVDLITPISRVIHSTPSHPEAINFMVVTVKGYCLRKAIV